MLNEHQLEDELVQDGLAFARMMADERLWPALKRMLNRMNDDAIGMWERDDTEQHTKKWLRGYREAVGGVEGKITQIAELAKSHVIAAQEAEKIVRSVSDDGIGSGDLSIA